jgi:hypothetical protein
MKWQSTLRKRVQRMDHYLIGFEPDKPEDILDLEKLLNPPHLVKSEKIGRNDP